LKYLIITEQKNNYFFPYIRDKDIVVETVYNTKNVVQDFLMKFKRKFGLNFDKYISSNEIGSEFDMIVFFDISCDYRNLPHLKGKNKDVRLFLWNIVDDFVGRLRKENKNADIEYVKSCFDKVYSFDKEDCKKYGLEYFPSLYTTDCKLLSSEYNNDIVFLGSEKGRGEILKNIYDTFAKYGVKQKYHVYMFDAPYVEADGFTLTSKTENYKTYLEWVAKSRGILDMPQSGQIGFTLRIMESVFLKKKLVTTYKDIINYKLYSRNNIFIVGYDDECRIKDFVNDEYEEVCDDVLMFYDCKMWLHNMKMNVEIPEGI
jgi:hypothetical protein